MRVSYAFYQLLKEAAKDGMAFCGKVEGDAESVNVEASVLLALGTLAEYHRDCQVGKYYANEVEAAA